MTLSGGDHAVQYLRLAVGREASGVLPDRGNARLYPFPGMACRRPSACRVAGCKVVATRRHGRQRLFPAIYRRGGILKRKDQRVGTLTQSEQVSLVEKGVLV